MSRTRWGIVIHALWSRSTLLALALMPAAAGVEAQELSVRDNAEQVSGGVLHVGAGAGCCGGTCSAGFLLENLGTSGIGAIELSASALEGALGTTIPATALSLAPPALSELGPTSAAFVRLTASVPAGTPGGAYRGTVAAQEVHGLARVELPVELTVCGAVPGLEIRLASGGNELVFLPGPGGCSGGHWIGRFTVENTGAIGLSAVTPAVSGFPGGVELRFSPAEVTLSPGERAFCQAALAAGPTIGAGHHRGTLAVADRAGLASDSVAASFDPCDAGRPEVAIVLPPGASDLVFEPGAEGCAGTRFRAAFFAENTGSETLAAVRPSLAGFPATVALTFTPASAALARGGRARFEVEAEVPPLLAPGVYAAALEVRDLASGAADDARATLLRCEAPRPGLRVVLAPGSSELVLEPGPEGCAGAGFAASFAVENTGRAPLRAVTPDLRGLPAGVTAAFEPAVASLAPGARAAFRVALAVPAGTAAGRYPAVLAVSDRTSLARDARGASFTRCDPPRPGISILLAGGATTLVLEPGPSGCSGTAFAASFTLANTGNTALAAVRPGLDGLPAGSVASFVPEAVALLPGESAGVALAVSVPSLLAPGGYPATLAARDPGGAAAATAALLVRCETPAPGIRIVLAPGAKALVLAPTAGCAGTTFSVAVVVENTGAIDLRAVRLAVSGFPSAIAASVRPASAPIGRGARASFALTATLKDALAAGTYMAAIAARDASGVADSAIARLERCPRGLPVVDPPGGVVVVVPGDEGAAPRLSLVHTASKASARMGEVLTLACRIKNLGPAVARGVVVEDLLPRGFVPVRGRVALDGRALEDPPPGSPCRFPLPDLGPGEEATLAFQVVVTPEARLGPATARAWVRAAAEQAGPMEAAVEVTRSTREPFGEVRGIVRYAIAGGAAPGVRILLDSSRETTSDEDGRVLFRGVLGGEHMVSLDQRSLPPGDRLASEDSRLFHLFEGASEEVEFLINPRPSLSLRLERLDLPRVVLADRKESNR